MSTSQVNLGLIWAVSGSGVTPVGEAKYVEGWINEIPTFQQFNYSIQGLDTNIVVMAEQGCFDWQDDIDYERNAMVRHAEDNYYLIRDDIYTNQVPAITSSVWGLAPVFGQNGDNAGTTETVIKGMHLNVVHEHPSDQTYTGQDMTISSRYPMLVLSESTTSTSSWAFGVRGNEAVVSKLENSSNPDARDLAKDGGNTHRIYHEGHVPHVSEVTDAVEDIADNTTLYARSNKTWVPVTSTIISSNPPASNSGSGSGWYNLQDGQLYLDIDDGDSSQWVVASPNTVQTIAASGTGIEEAPDDGQEYARVSKGWEVVDHPAGGGIGEAPNDGQEYVRKSEAWAVATAGGGGPIDVLTYNGTTVKATAVSGGVDVEGSLNVKHNSEGDVSVWNDGYGGVMMQSEDYGDGSIRRIRETGLPSFKYIDFITPETDGGDQADYNVRLFGNFGTVQLETNALGIKIRNSPTYADDAAALAGGLEADQVYKTATGVLMIKL